MFRGIFLRFPGGKPKALTFSYDDGGAGDKRLLDILNQHNLKGTFNINTVKKEYQTAEGFKDYEGHEIAVHTEHHPILDHCHATAKLYEVFKCREKLEEVTGKIIRGMAYPYRYDGSKASYDALRTAGIAYARVTPPTFDFKLPTDWYDWHPTCHHREERLMELADKFINADVNNTDSAEKAPLLFYVWGHTYEFNNNNNWYIIEDFAKVISNKPDVWYATNIEIYDYVEKFRHLIFSLDSKIIYNPTDITLYFNMNEKEYSIRSGETIKVEY